MMVIQHAFPPCRINSKSCGEIYQLLLQLLKSPLSPALIIVSLRLDFEVGATDTDFLSGLKSYFSQKALKEIEVFGGTCTYVCIRIYIGSTLDINLNLK